ncbi:MAG TPA: hypothetical protein DD719_04190 [Desulfotomaculum sp.]|jgi:predicted nucleotidyltransferase|nr:hypothetical protein [Desulfotomaculum sp.]HCJ79183.1 hypothetical protein [Desulfotomaculum sp.]
MIDEEYFRAWKKRAWQTRQKVQKREDRARQLARKMAYTLAEEFAVSRVYLIGSLLHPGCFNLSSDIDLVVEGLDPAKLYQAERRLEEIVDIPFDLIDGKEISKKFYARILQEGLILYERN